MRKITVLVVAAHLCGMLGCERRPPSDEECALAEAQSLIAVLATNVSVRSIRESGRVRTLLKRIRQKPERDALTTGWLEALRDVRVECLRPTDRYGAVREVYHTIDTDVLGALWEDGWSYEERWSVRLDAVRWLDRQISAMRPSPESRPETWLDWRNENEKWSGYQALSEYRESEVENLELNGFDEARYPKDVDKMAAIRAKFERQIGRPVRRSEDVKYLGRYRREVTSRIQKERAEALKEMSAKDVEHSVRGGLQDDEPD